MKWNWKLLVAFIIGTIIGFSIHSLLFGLGVVKIEWLPVAGTLLGALIGGGITFILQTTDFKRNKKKEDQKLYLQKLEELHESIYDLKLACTKFSISWAANLRMADESKKIR